MLREQYLEKAEFFELMSFLRQENHGSDPLYVVSPFAPSLEHAFSIDDQENVWFGQDEQNKRFPSDYPVAMERVGSTLMEINSDRRIADRRLYATPEGVFAEFGHGVEMILKFFFDTDSDAPNVDTPLIPLTTK